MDVCWGTLTKREPYRSMQSLTARIIISPATAQILQRSSGSILYARARTRMWGRDMIMGDQLIILFPSRSRWDLISHVASHCSCAVTLGRDNSVWKNKQSLFSNYAPNALIICEILLQVAVATPPLAAAICDRISR